MLDTHAAVKRLQAAGMDERQAEGDCTSPPATGRWPSAPRSGSETGADSIPRAQAWRRSSSRPHVEHDGEIEKPSPRWDIRDVDDPEAVRPLRHKLAIDLIDGPVRGRIADGGRDEATRVQASQARRPHQPRHTFLPDPMVVLIGQLRVNTRRPVRAVRTPVDRMDRSGP